MWERIMIRVTTQEREALQEIGRMERRDYREVASLIIHNDLGVRSIVQAKQSTEYLPANREPDQLTETGGCGD